MNDTTLGLFGCAVAALGLAGAAAASPSILKGRGASTQRIQGAAEILQTLSTRDIEVLETREHLRAALAIRPDDPGLRGERAWRFNELAIEELERVLATTPDNEGAAQLLAEAYNDKAYFLYLRRQDLPLALKLINKAIALQESESYFLSTKAEVLYALGRPREALPHIRRALRDYPDEPELLHDLKMIQSAISTARR